MNPIKELREQNGLTQEDVARLADCSKNVVIRTEQGCYPEPPPVLLEFFLYNPRVKHAIDEQELLIRYREFQRLVRIENYGRLNADYPFLLEATIFTDPPEYKHPFVAWREASGLNPTQIAKYYCIHQAIIYKFEKQPYLMNSLPKPIVDALLESGYGPVVIHRLEEAFKRYKSAISERLVVEQRRD